MRRSSPRRVSRAFRDFPNPGAPVRYDIQLDDNGAPVPRLAVSVELPVRYGRQAMTDFTAPPALAALQMTGPRAGSRSPTGAPALDVWVDHPSSSRKDDRGYS
jgi:hypothetical protein